MPSLQQERMYPGTLFHIFVVTNLALSLATVSSGLSFTAYTHLQPTAVFPAKTMPKSQVPLFFNVAIFSSLAIASLGVQGSDKDLTQTE